MDQRPQPPDGEAPLAVPSDLPVGVPAAQGREDDRIDSRGELVIALVTPIGLDIEPVREALTDALDQLVRFDAASVRVSALIEPYAGPEGGSNRWRRLMDAGDDVRRLSGDYGICAMLTVQAIVEVRRAETGDEDVWRPSGATIVHSLKHPDEVSLLRRVYGQRLVVVGVSEDRAARERWLRRRLTPDNATREQEAAAAGSAADLIRRDEKDEGVDWGQRVRDAYEMCDVYLPSSGEDLDKGARRLVELLFAKPFVTPDRDEMGVWHAYAAKFRSSAAGRQVGAVIVDGDGELLATGCNDVPAPGGGQNWDGEPHDHRDFALGSDANDQHKFRLAEEMFAALVKAEWIAPALAGKPAADLAETALAKAGPLDRTRVANLVEFGRIMHAEMAALMTAARRGTPVRGATLYTTTYPCHECMRLIIGAGVSRVVYVDPYPKSMVPELYGRHLAGSDGDGPKVRMDAFVGIAPRLVPLAFGQLRARRRDERGAYLKWQGRTAGYVGVEDRYADTTRIHELQVAKDLDELLPLLRADTPPDPADQSVPVGGRG